MTPLAHDLRLALLNPWQRDFPLQREPWGELARPSGLSVPELLQTLQVLQHDGSLSRVGGVFAGSAGGAALLSAMAVPPDRLDAVAQIVSAHPGVNHNYEREHRLNLWFVMTGASAEAVEQAMRGLEAATGLRALRLPMRRPYRIDLGFDLRARTAPAHASAPPPADPPRRHATPAAIADADRPLAALVEAGLPLCERPFDVWAQALGRSPESVLATLRGWLADGRLRRFGMIVRHHELGFAANAMTVFEVPDDQVDALGERLARQPGVTLAYRRAPDSGWPYTLYCMVHGQDREAVQQALAQAIDAAGLRPHPHLVLFSRRRFKQTGARRFRDLPTPTARETAHALA